MSIDKDFREMLQTFSKTTLIELVIQRETELDNVKKYNKQLQKSLDELNEKWLDAIRDWKALIKQIRSEK